jgi:hypothetical protein
LAAFLVGYFYIIALRYFQLKMYCSFLKGDSTMSADGFLKQHSHEPNKCSKCGKPLEPNVDGKRPTLDGKVVCLDCFHDEAGSFFEKNPIGQPGRRGPGTQTNLD